MDLESVTVQVASGLLAPDWNFLDPALWIEQLPIVSPQPLSKRQPL